LKDFFTDDTELLISSTTGLYRAVFDGSTIKSLRRHLYWSCFGMTTHDENTYAFASDGENGWILDIKWDRYGLSRANPVIAGLSRKCHQIASSESNLYVTDPQRNQLHIYDLHTLRHTKTMRMPRGTDHLNSIFIDSEGIWLMLHNKSSKSGKNSQIIRYSHDFRSFDVVDTSAWNAHNVVRRNAELIYCDSHRGTVVIGDSEVQLTGFTRGLVVEGGMALVGSSPVADRELRISGDCPIYVVDLDTRTIAAKIILPDIGAIHDIMPYRRMRGSCWSPVERQVAAPEPARAS
jgi:hypothetical protein